MRRSFASLWQRLCRHAEIASALSDPRRIGELEAFRRALITACGDEPRVGLASNDPARVLAFADPLELPMTEYLGLVLAARHAALYELEVTGEFACLARYGAAAAPLPADGVLASWLVERGPLIRSTLSLDGLSLEESEALLGELDRLNAACLVPLCVEEHVTHVLALGASWWRAYDAMDAAALSLALAACSRSRARMSAGLPSVTAAQHGEEARECEAVLSLWQSLRAGSSVRVLVVDESPKVVEILTQLFHSFGLLVTGCSDELQTIEALQRERPDLVVLDLSFRRRVPAEVVRAMRVWTPEAVVFGMTSGFGEMFLEPWMAPVVQSVFRKPLRLAALLRAVLEAACELSLRETAI